MLLEQQDDPGVDPEDPDEYAARAVFYLPENARWSFLQTNARQPAIGTLVDDAMKAIEDSNPKQLRGVLPRDYARPALDKARLGQVIDLMSNLGVGGAEHRSRDDQRWKYGTPPAGNMSEWGGQALRDDQRWKYGTPPAGNANYAWIQLFIHHLRPDGFAGFVMANGSLSSNSSGEGKIRRRIVEADLVDCVVALPGQLFYTTQIPVCLWFLARNKSEDRYRRRAGETLFIDARKLGTMIDRTHRDLTDGHRPVRGKVPRLAG